MKFLVSGLVTGYNSIDGSATRDERFSDNTNRGDLSGGNKNDNNGISPLVLYVIFGVGAAVIIVVVVAAVVSLRCQRQSHDPRSNDRGNKSYLQPSHVNNMGTIERDQREKLNPPPPDLWIGHDQLELKAMDGDETGETTLSRSTHDYRSNSSIDGSRNYIMPYSGMIMNFMLAIDPFFVYTSNRLLLIYFCRII